MTDELLSALERLIAQLNGLLAQWDREIAEVTSIERGPIDYRAGLQRCREHLWICMRAFAEAEADVSPLAVVRAPQEQQSESKGGMPSGPMHMRSNEQHAQHLSDSRATVGDGVTHPSENTSADVQAPQETKAEQEAVNDATAQLVIELAFLVPDGTDFRTHPISQRLENYKHAIEARAGVRAPQSPDWKLAALLKDRTRQAIRERMRAGDAADAVAADFGVPLEFVELLSSWQLFEDQAVGP